MLEGLREAVPVPAGADEADLTAATLTQTRRVLGLDEFGRLALGLAQLCAFLSPNGVTMTLLTSRALLSELAATSAPDAAVIESDSAALHRVMYTGAEYGLFDLDWQRGSLRMHRIVQQVLRDLLPPDQREQRRRQVLHALASFAPTDAEGDNAARSENLAELARHLSVSGALFSRDREVRRWVVQHFRWVYRTGDARSWAVTTHLGEEVFSQWKALSPDRPDDLTLRLGAQLANLHRTLGNAARALELDDEVRPQQQRTLGLYHPRTLITARGRGGDLRGLGRFDEAHDEDLTTLPGFARVYGPEHPDTLMAASNLALSFLLVGNLNRALPAAQEVHRTTTRVLGPDHPFTLRVGVLVGVIHRERGEYPESLQALRDALDRVGQRTLSNQEDQLAIRRHLAVTNRRRTGGLSNPIREDTKIQASYVEVFGDDHPGSRASRVSLAMDHHLRRDVSEAIRLGRRCVDDYSDAVGPGHPFTHACRVNLGLFLRAAGDVDQALAVGREALAGLRDELSDSHPWILGAQNNLIGHLVAAGETGRARQLAERLRDEVLPGSSPDTLPGKIAVLRNLQAIEALEALGDGAAQGRPEPIPTLIDMDLDIPDT